MKLTTTMLLGGVVAIVFANAAIQANAAGVAIVEAPARNSSQPVNDTQTSIETLRNHLGSGSLDVQKALKVIQDAADQKSRQQSFFTESARGNSSNTNKPNGGSTTSIPAIPNSDANYLDDHLYWDVPIHVYATGTSGGVKLDTTYCLPAGTRIIGLSPTFTAATPNTATAQAGPENDNGKSGDGSSYKKPAANYLPVKLDMNGAPFLKGQNDLHKGGNISAQVQDTGDSGSMCPESSPSGSSTSETTPLTITPSTQFYVAADDLDAAAVREGWAYGALVVPFKFELSGKNAILSSATLGGYLGYRFPIDLWGVEFRPVLFGGLSEIPTSQATGGSSSSQTTVAGVSWGAGLITTIKDTFDVGIVVGFDHIDSAEHFDYQDHPWISIELGIPLTK